MTIIKERKKKKKKKTEEKSRKESLRSELATWSFIKTDALPTEIARIL